MATAYSLMHHLPLNPPTQPRNCNSDLFSRQVPPGPTTILPDELGDQLGGGLNDSSRRGATQFDPRTAGSEGVPARKRAKRHQPGRQTLNGGTFCALAGLGPATLRMRTAPTAPLGLVNPEHDPLDGQEPTRVCVSRSPAIKSAIGSRESTSMLRNGAVMSWCLSGIEPPYYAMMRADPSIVPLHTE